MSKFTPEEQRNIAFRTCRKFNLHLYSTDACLDIVRKLAEVAEYVEEIQDSKKTEEYDDLRVMDNEYIASYLGTSSSKNNPGYITFHRESGSTKLKFGFSASNDRDWIPVLNILKEFVDISIQSDGSIRTVGISKYPTDTIFRVNTFANNNYNIDAVCPCYTTFNPICHYDIRFQPSGYDEDIYALNTGLPIINQRFHTTTLSKSNPFGSSFTPSEDHPESVYYLSWHFQSQIYDDGNPVPLSHKGVILVHKNKQAFLDGDKPLIIVFKNINGCDEVYRKLPNGSYIVNSSVIINPDDSISYDDLSYQEIVDRSETHIHPYPDIIMTAVRGEFEKIIPQKYIELHKEIINKVRHDKTKPEDDEPIY